MTALRGAMGSCFAFGATIVWQPTPRTWLARIAVPADRLDGSGVELGVGMPGSARVESIRTVGHGSTSGKPSLDTCKVTS